MKTNALNYSLPPELIAQHPARPRDSSRLLVMRRKADGIEHCRFFDIEKYLVPGDLIILNNTRVLPYRMIMQRLTGGRVEMLLVKNTGDNIWEAMLASNRRLNKGEELVSMVDNRVRAVLAGRTADRWQVKLPSDFDEDMLARLGVAPLPPYIKRDNTSGRLRASDIRDYQTVYAHAPGAIAAPTAGLHFTRPLINRLIKQGVRFVYVTLQVGPGTFKPIKSEDLSGHKMEAEQFEVMPDAVREIMQAKRDHRRIIAVGTTVTRVLETVSGYISSMLVHPWLQQHNVPRASVVGGNTDLFIRPPYKFKLVDGLITNFHQPHGTPLALVFAFAGRPKVLNAYKKAISRKYRFFSYGDAMLVI
ncbi:MAG: tRNA preQ1(34) S-adenosylmethionine ribosyltransferase-isomerase QueA [Candidatus Brocadiia bacterium]